MASVTLSPDSYIVLANAVLVAHVGVVLFIIGALILTLMGGWLGWAWVRNFWFRAMHLAAIAYVAMEAWLGIVCPLTTLELWLRLRGGQLTYEGDFIAFWLRELLFFEAPSWVFIAAYSLFALLVLVSWVLVPPRRGRS
ncbi:DUF2784 domain-containing protein [Massilia sp. PAMC28688]|uniref:DUF2784 domain-containing protein n=1 Tax=Massilia sp. PAMC28688 TaxID=2861283 RepID=UPI001C6387FA|nr:DUF2784 domain-containing protein [Massilia sp. PAMC28688]QYF94860.1 DUF2784 domain-containing protein [Massilia sp. PAMC28688]